MKKPKRVNIEVIVPQGNAIALRAYLASHGIKSVVINGQSDDDGYFVATLTFVQPDVAAASKVLVALGAGVSYPMAG